MNTIIIKSSNFMHLKNFLSPRFFESCHRRRRQRVLVWRDKIKLSIQLNSRAGTASRHFVARVASCSTFFRQTVFSLFNFLRAYRGVISMKRSFFCSTATLFSFFRVLFPFGGVPAQSQMHRTVHGLDTHVCLSRHWPKSNISAGHLFLNIWT